MNIKVTLKNSNIVYTYRLKKLQYYEKDDAGNECLMIHGTLIKENNEHNLELSEGDVFDNFAFEPFSVNPPEKIEFY